MDKSRYADFGASTNSNIDLDLDQLNVNDAPLSYDGANDDNIDLLLDTPVAGSKRAAQAAETNSDRDAALAAELATLQRINTVVAGTTASLDRARSNMRQVQATVGQSSALLDTWTRILAQAEHNQRLILHPAWQGATHDLSEAEADAGRREQERAQKQQAAEQRRRDEEARRAQEQEAAELERARKAQGDTSKVPGRTTSTRGRAGANSRGRGMTRSASSTTARPTATASTNTSMVSSSAFDSETDPKAAAREARARGRAAIMHYGRVRGSASSRSRGRGS